MPIFSYFNDVSVRPGLLARSTFSNGVWSAPERLTVNGVTSGNFVDPDMLRLADGSWLLSYRDLSAPTTLFTAVSQDGVNFTDVRAAFAPVSGNAPADPSIVRLLDGSFLMAFSQPGSDLVTFAAGSDGRSYTLTGVSVHAGLPGQGGANELVQYSDGNLRLFSASGPGVQTMVSGDGGRTWAAEPGAALVDSSRFPNAPSVFRTADGTWVMLVQESTSPNDVTTNNQQMAISSDGVHFTLSQRDAILHASVPEGIDTAARQRVFPTAGNDVFTGTADNERFDGQGGLDFVLLSGARAQTRFTASGSATVATGPGGTDTLVNIERAVFSDRVVAFDAQGSAGNSARIIGAAFGTANLTPDLVGTGIRLFDQALSMHDIAQAALGTPLFLQLAGSHDNAAMVRLVHLNVLGRLPTADEQAFYVGVLNSGASQADLLTAAANSQPNADMIHLTGIAQTGIDYV